MSATAPRIPLFNHLIKVRKTTTPLPVAGNTAHFQHLHDTYLHEVEGEDCYEIPLDVIAKHVNKHKDNFGAVTVLLDMLANRGIVHQMSAIKAGVTEPAQLFAHAYDEEIEAPVESHVTTAAGKSILPLNLHDACMLYGKHHHHSSGPVVKDVPAAHHGGQMSLDAIAALDGLLAEIGVKPNHAVIRSAYCHNCKGKGNAGVPDNS
jgi:hypothetical protein